MKTKTTKEIIGATLLLAICCQAQIDPSSARIVPRAQLPRTGTFWSASRGTAPSPGPPADPSVPILQLGDGQFLILDADVDQAALRETVAGIAALSETRLDVNVPQGNDPMDRDPNGIYLDIESWPIDGKYVSFNTRAGLVYNVQESTNLISWSDRQTIVANDTNASFFLYDTGPRFFRVVQLDDRIQFPDWDDEVEQFLYFDAWTSIQGTYHEELYGDGQLLFQTTGTVPASGLFGVYDGNYNPANWPNAGFYDVEGWEFRATVTPSAPGATNATAVVKKRFRRPYDSRRGLTIQQYGAFTISYLRQEEIDQQMLIYCEGCMEATPQANLSLEWLVPPIVESRVPKIMDNNGWGDFRFDIYHGYFSDLHYFGHGASDQLGSGFPTNLTMLILTNSPSLATNHMRYVALDGCNTAEKTTFLGAWIGYTKEVSRSQIISKGWIPRFGWGWTNKKGMGYAFQGELNWNHFNFVTDYYTYLTHRDPSGLFDHTYKNAIAFAQDPNRLGVNPNVTHNPEGNSINYTGCSSCFFDE